ncbi:hypothetical protein [Candidatus Binatus sp.]|uniref:hypothetical protein n=1 Tax=Candidatus Binatus sp. TaxID=2811406 RepID=UPI003CC56A53
MRDVRHPPEFVDMRRVAPRLAAHLAEFLICAMHRVALDAAGKLVSLVDRAGGREQERKEAGVIAVMQQEPHSHRSDAVGGNELEARPFVGLRSVEARREAQRRKTRHVISVGAALVAKPSRVVRIDAARARARQQAHRPVLLIGHQLPASVEHARQLERGGRIAGRDVASRELGIDLDLIVEREVGRVEKFARLVLGVVAAEVGSDLPRQRQERRHSRRAAEYLHADEGQVMRAEVAGGVARSRFVEIGLRRESQRARGGRLLPRDLQFIFLRRGRQC